MSLTKEMTIESEMPPHKDANPEKITDFWNVYTSNDIHEKVFGEKAGSITKYPWKKRIIKITSKATKLSVYRIWRGVPAYVTSKDILYIDNNAKYSLINDRNNNEVEVVLSKGCRFGYYWNHFDNATRVSFKLGFVSVILGIISLILGAWSICISCME